MDEQTQLKHLEFILVGKSESGKTNLWEVKNKTLNYEIGMIKWAGNFRKYAFYPKNDTMYDSNCLHAIADFLTQVTKDR